MAGGLQAAFSFGIGSHSGNLSFNITTDNIEVARELCELGGYIGLGVGLTSLGVLLGYRLLRPLIQDVVNVVFGYNREDQDNPNAEAGSLHVKLRCLTEKRFLEVLQDYESGGIKQRLENEFPQVGIKVEGLKVEIENMEEVEKTRTAIVERVGITNFGSKRGKIFSFVTGSILTAAALRLITKKSFESTNVITKAVFTSEMSFGFLFAGYYVLNPLLKHAVSKALGGKRDDQDPPDVRPG